MWTSEEIIANMGNGIKTLRLQRNLDRETLAIQAGIGINTLARLESGQGSSLRALVSILICLNRQDWALSIAPQVTINPLDPLLGRGKRRQRASGSRKASHGIGRKKTYLLKTYGLTIDQYAKMLNYHQGKCGNPGCKNRLDPDSRETHVDHNHETGEVRSLLCAGCNTALGMIKEDKERAAGLVEYIDKHNHAT